MSQMKIIQGDTQARDLRFAIVAARFNASIVERLVRGACDTLRQHGAKDDQIDIVNVPGAFEIPVAVRRLLANPRHDAAPYAAVIALGAVIRGDTPHFEFVAGECATGISRLALESGIPIAFGVLTTDTYEQALERAGPTSPSPSTLKGRQGKDTTKGGNKGSEAALCAIEMANLMLRLGVE